MQPGQQQPDRESRGTFSLIIFVREADMRETQILTKSHGISSSAEKW
jgi:hypothetical protein